MNQDHTVSKDPPGALGHTPSKLVLTLLAAALLFAIFLVTVFLASKDGTPASGDTHTATTPLPTSTELPGSKHTGSLNSAVPTLDQTDNSPAHNAPTVTLSKGETIAFDGCTGACFRLDVLMHNFEPNTRYEVSCANSVTPDGYFSYETETDQDGSSSTSFCYQSVSLDTWVMVADTKSNVVNW